jgi:hypothetical protein
MNNELVGELICLFIALSFSIAFGLVLQHDNNKNKEKN